MPRVRSRWQWCDQLGSGHAEIRASGTKIISPQVPANGQYVPATEVENVAELVSSEDAAADSAKVILTQNPSFTIEEHEGTLAPTAVGIASPGDTLHYVVEKRAASQRGSCWPVLPTTPLMCRAALIILLIPRAQILRPDYWSGTSDPSGRVLFPVGLLSTR